MVCIVRGEIYSGYNGEFIIGFNIDQFAYVLQRPKNQVYIGTAADIRSRFGSQEPVYFCSEDELLDSLNSFRDEELIITTVSELPIIKQKWDDKNQYTL